MEHETLKADINIEWRVWMKSSPVLAAASNAQVRQSRVECLDRAEINGPGTESSLVKVVERDVRAKQCMWQLAAFGICLLEGCSRDS